MLSDDQFLLVLSCLDHPALTTMPPLDHARLVARFLAGHVLERCRRQSVACRDEILSRVAADIEGAQKRFDEQQPWNDNGRSLEQLKAAILYMYVLAHDMERLRAYAARVRNGS